MYKFLENYLLKLFEESSKNKTESFILQRDFKATRILFYSLANKCPVKYSNIVRYFANLRQFDWIGIAEMEFCEHCNIADEQTQKQNKSTIEQLGTENTHSSLDKSEENLVESIRDINDKE